MYTPDAVKVLCRHLALGRAEYKICVRKWLHGFHRVWVWTRPFSLLPQMLSSLSFSRNTTSNQRLERFSSRNQQFTDFVSDFFIWQFARGLWQTPRDHMWFVMDPDGPLVDCERPLRDRLWISMNHRRDYVIFEHEMAKIVVFKSIHMHSMWCNVTLCNYNYNVHYTTCRLELIDESHMAVIYNDLVHSSARGQRFVDRVTGGASQRPHLYTCFTIDVRLLNYLRIYLVPLY